MLRLGVAVTVTQLSAFLAVVRHGSVTGAAEELVVTQPSVSAAISALERELGVDLTERVGRSIRPTAAGEAYARYAGDVLALLKEGSEVAGQVARGGNVPLRVTAVTTAGEYLLPALLHAFQEQEPDIEVTVHVGNREEVFRRLEAHEADVAISGRAPTGRGFQGSVFLDNEFVLITSPEDPLAKRPWVAVDELAAVPWLMREHGSGTRRLCETYLASHQLQPPMLTLGSNGAIKSAARVGLGVALQSREAVALELEVGLLQTIRPRGGLPKRSWYVVRSTVGPGSAAANAFTQFVRSPEGAETLARSHGDEVRQTRRRLRGGRAQA
jgi:DNA-binding transcriptional LysR family regulator